MRAAGIVFASAGKRLRRAVGAAPGSSRAAPAPLERIPAPFERHGRALERAASPVHKGRPFEYR